MEKIKQECASLNVTINLLPVLDGWVYYFEENATAIKIDKALNLYGEIEEGYRDRKLLGSSFDRDSYSHSTDKKNFPRFISYKIENEQFDAMVFEYHGKAVTFKNKKEFDKFLKSIRTAIPK